MDPVRYAIIDGAIESELLSFLATQSPPHCCLYSPPVQPELLTSAPYLVQVTAEVEEWLKFKTTPWGITLYSSQNLHPLLQHLRQYLWVKIPQQEKPVLMRFYDPRIIWNLLTILTPRQHSIFISPMSKVMTDYDDTHQEENYDSGAGVNSVQESEMLIISPWQYKKLNQLTQKNYIRKLAGYIQSCYETEQTTPVPEKETLYHRAEDYLNYCHSFGIIDNRSVRGITFLFLKQGIDDSNNAPEKWEELLSIQDTSVYYRVEKLLLQELGYIPE